MNKPAAASEGYVTWDPGQALRTSMAKFGQLLPLWLDGEGSSARVGEGPFVRHDLLVAVPASAIRISVFCDPDFRNAGGRTAIIIIVVIISIITTSATFQASQILYFWLTTAEMEQEEQTKSRRKGDEATSAS